MSQRFFIGNDTAGNFVIRQSKPGYHAIYGQMDGLVFDSDLYPGRIIGSGSYYVPGSNSYRTPGVLSTPHNCGKTPDMVLVRGKMMQSAIGGAAPLHDIPWQGKYNPYGSTFGYPLAAANNNMTNQNCSLFYVDESITGGNGAGQTGQIGWRITYDNVNITGYNYSNATEGTNPPGFYYNYITYDWYALEL
jgi:hypothetical protein